MQYYQEVKSRRGREGGPVRSGCDNAISQPIRLFGKFIHEVFLDNCRARAWLHGDILQRYRSILRQNMVNSTLLCWFQQGLVSATQRMKLHHAFGNQ